MREASCMLTSRGLMPCFLAHFSKSLSTFAWWRGKDGVVGCVRNVGHDAFEKGVCLKGKVIFSMA